ncbi:MAG TPA: glycosyltransferase family 87 protein [Thermohalobaculum sp.]|nr:glycosyltransferase family 87 protein [Thermohalobaculum sp.]
MPGDLVKAAARAAAGTALPPARPRGDRAARIVFWIAAYLFLFYLFRKAGAIAIEAPHIDVHRVDFVAFWAAARLALAGQPLAAFDPAALFAAAELAGEAPKNLLWLYPPGFLALIAPLGALPHWAAWSVFVLVSAAALARAARAPAAGLPGGWRLMVVSPLLLMGVFDIGQTSALWAAALIAALWSLRQGRPAMAGLCIALLTLKPQLGLLIPVALAADRQWRTIGWATGFAAIILLASTLLFGAAYWPQFLAALAEVTDRLEAGTSSMTKLVSFYGFARMSGLGHGAALWIQWPAAVALAAAVAWVWSRRDTGPDLKAALLCAAIPLATPYAYYYEMTTTLAAGLFLARDGFGRSLAARLWLLVIWLGPIPVLYTPALTDQVTFAGTPIMAVTVAICLARAWRRTRPAPAGLPEPTDRAADGLPDDPPRTTPPGRPAAGT